MRVVQSVIIISLIVMTLAACGSSPSQSNPSTPPTSSSNTTTRSVIYRLTPSGYSEISPTERAQLGLPPATGPKVTDNILITVRNGTGGTEQRTVDTPAELTYTMPTGAFAYISAQQGSLANGMMTCEIVVEGQVAAKSSSTGPNTIVTCSATVP